VVELPGTAIAQEDERNFVWIVDPKDQTVRRRPVSIRPGHENGPVVVTEGLAQGDIVVTAGVRSLAEGQRVRLAKQIETAAAS
jgi:multidrug efflux pump subunit AcrA (membrane-fusion protein)